MEIRQLIQLRIKGVSTQRHAILLQINRNTVNEYVRCLMAMDDGLATLLVFSDAQYRGFSPHADTTKDNK